MWKWKRWPGIRGMFNIKKQVLFYTQVVAGKLSPCLRDKVIHTYPPTTIEDKTEASLGTLARKRKAGEANGIYPVSCVLTPIGLNRLALLLPANVYQSTSSSPASQAESQRTGRKEWKHDSSWNWIREMQDIHTYASLLQQPPTASNPSQPRSPPRHSISSLLNQAFLRIGNIPVQHDMSLINPPPRHTYPLHSLSHLTWHTFFTIMILNKETSSAGRLMRWNNRTRYPHIPERLACRR